MSSVLRKAVLSFRRQPEAILSPWLRRCRDFGPSQLVGPLQLAQAPAHSLCLVCAVHWRTVLALWR